MVALHIFICHNPTLDMQLWVNKWIKWMGILYSSESWGILHNVSIMPAHTAAAIALLNVHKLISVYTVMQ